jgi:hypothetical protein
MTVFRLLISSNANWCARIAVASWRGTAVADLTNTDVYMCGSAAGGCALVVTVPAELMKCQLQTQLGSGSSNVRGNIDCARQLYSHGGVSALYRGFLITAMRDIPSWGVQFAVYDMVSLTVA